MSRPVAFTLIIFSLLFFVVVPVHSSEHEHEQHLAHVHGESELLVAIDANILEIMFNSPAINLLGYEHSPQSPEEKQKYQLVAKQLQNNDLLFTFPVEAGCKIQNIDVEMPFQEEIAENHTAHNKESHVDYSGIYRFYCHKHELFKEFRIKIFNLFPLVEHIEVKVISENGQHAYELMPGQDTIEM